MDFSISTEYLLNNEMYKRKYYEFDYIIKLFNPEIAFKNIHTDMYPIFLKENLSQITKLFIPTNLNETVIKLGDIIKLYNRERWG